MAILTHSLPFKSLGSKNEQQKIIVMTWMGGRETQEEGDMGIYVYV